MTINAGQIGGENAESYTAAEFSTQETSKVASDDHNSAMTILPDGILGDGQQSFICDPLSMFGWWWW